MGNCIQQPANGADIDLAWDYHSALAQKSRSLLILNTKIVLCAGPLEMYLTTCPYILNPHSAIIMIRVSQVETDRLRKPTFR